MDSQNPADGGSSSGDRNTPSLFHPGPRPTIDATHYTSSSSAAGELNNLALSLGTPANNSSAGNQQFLGVATNAINPDNSFGMSIVPSGKNPLSAASVSPGLHPQSSSNQDSLIQHVNPYIYAAAGDKNTYEQSLNTLAKDSSPVTRQLLGVATHGDFSGDTQQFLGFATNATNPSNYSSQLFGVSTGKNPPTIASVLPGELQSSLNQDFNPYISEAAGNPRNPELSLNIGTGATQRVTTHAKNPANDSLQLFGVTMVDAGTSITPRLDLKLPYSRADQSLLPALGDNSSHHIISQATTVYSHAPSNPQDVCLAGNPQISNITLRYPSQAQSSGSRRIVTPPSDRHGGGGLKRAAESPTLARSLKVIHSGPTKINFIPSPYPWTTNKRARSLSVNSMNRTGNDKIMLEVECLGCDWRSVYQIAEVDVNHIAIYAARYLSTLGERAPPELVCPRPGKCNHCNKQGIVPLISEKKRGINWYGLFFSSGLGWLNVNQLLYFCNHNNIAWDDCSRDLLIFKVSQGIVTQLLAPDTEP